MLYPLTAESLNELILKRLGAVFLVYNHKMQLSVYIHIPFCIHRCGYCDFNTYAGLEALIPSYTQALAQEIAAVSQAGDDPAPGPTSAAAAEASFAQNDGEIGADSDAPLPNPKPRRPVHTVFFGGGTPSLLPLPALEKIFTALHRRFDISPQAEITMEANPGTLSPEYLGGLRSLGVNRLSLGVQSANPLELRLLERQHDFTDVIQSVAWARHAGIDNLNLDLIFGLPEQPLSNWRHSIDAALRLQPSHLSLYALSLEHGTPFGRWARRGLLSTPDPDAAAEMYEWAAERLEQAGFIQYEISNWARAGTGDDTGDTRSPRLACAHNLQYWRNLPYLGLGAGAHGYAGGLRTVNALAPAAYIQRLAAPPGRQPFPLTPAVQSHTPIDRAAEIGETMMMGLRLTREGVSEIAFRARFGQSLREVFPKQIEKLSALGLLEQRGDILRLTPKARLLGNVVFREFI